MRTSWPGALAHDGLQGRDEEHGQDEHARQRRHLAVMGAEPGGADVDGRGGHEHHSPIWPSSHSSPLATHWLMPWDIYLYENSPGCGQAQKIRPCQVDESNRDRRLFPCWPLVHPSGLHRSPVTVAKESIL